MKLFSGKKDKEAVFKTLSGLAINLSAGWYALVLIAANFLPIRGGAEILSLIVDVVFGTLCLLISFRLERKLL